MALKSIGRFYVTSDGIDRDSERMIPTGARFDNFEKHPVMLWNHNRSRSWDDGESKKLLPIGKWLNREVDEKGISFEGFVSDSTQFGVDVLNLCNDEVLNATSIGFIPVKWSNDVKDKLPGQEGYTITDYEVIEISLADIPANPNATRKSFGQKGEEELEVFSSMDQFVKSGKETGIIVKSFSPKSVSKNFKQVDNNFIKALMSVLGITKTEGRNDVELETDIKTALEKGNTAVIQKVADALKKFQDESLDAIVKNAVEEGTKSLVTKVDGLGAELKSVKEENDALKKQMKEFVEADDSGDDGDKVEVPGSKKIDKEKILDLSKQFLDA